MSIEEPNSSSSLPPPQQPTAASTPGALPHSAVAPPPRRKRRWLRVVGIVIVAVVVLVGLVIALIPTIASSGWARGKVVSKVNEKLNGHLEIADWSFGWNGNIRIDGVRLFDDQNRKVLEVAHLTGGKIHYLQVARGNYNLGKFVVDGLDFAGHRYTDGTLNFQHLVKSEPSETKPGPEKTETAKAEPKEEKASDKLPDVSVELALINSHGTFEDEQKKQLINFSTLQGDISIPNINQPIEDSLKVIASVNNSAPGTLELSGKVLVVRDNRVLPMDQIFHDAELTQKISAQQFDLAALGVTGGDIEGVLNGNVAVALQPNSDATLKTDLASALLRVGALEITGLKVTADGTFNDKGGKLTSQTAIAKLTNLKPLPGAQAEVLSNWTLDVLADAGIDRSNAGTTTTLNDLRITDSAKLFTITKAGGAFQVAMSSTGTATGTGSIDYTADLQKINNLLRNLSAAPEDPTAAAAAESQGIKLEKGAMQGTIRLASQNQHFNVSDVTTIADLTMAAPASSTTAPAVLNGEKITINADISAKDDLSAIDSGKIVVDGSVATASLSDLSVLLKSGTGKNAGSVPVLKMLRNVAIKIDVPSLAKLDAMRKAFATPPTLAMNVDMFPLRPRAGSPLEIQLALAAGTMPATLPAKKAPPAAPVTTTLTAGSLSVEAKISSDADHLNLTSKVDGKDIAFQASKIAPEDPEKPAGPRKLQRIDQTVGPVDFTTAVSITTGEGASVMEQIRELSISQLSAHVLGTEVAFKQPLKLTDLRSLSQLIPTTKPGESPASPTALTAALNVKGKVAPLCAVLDAMDAEEPGSKHPYSGDFNFDYSIGKESGELFARGGGAITDFQVQDPRTKQPTFNEPTVQIANNVSLSGQAITINDLSLAMQGTKAFSVKLVGKVEDLYHQRLLQNIKPTVTYDLAALWKIIYPTLSAQQQKQYKDAVVAGQYTEQFTVGGSYPAGMPSEKAIAHVTAQGELGVGAFKARGIDLKDWIIPLFLKDGVLRVAKSEKPGDYAKAASMNGGELALDGAALDLNDPHPRLNTPSGWVPVKNVSLTPALADMFGSSFGNFLFAGAAEASGQMTITFEQCQNLPLDDLLKKSTPANNGYLAMNIAIPDVTLGSPQLTKILEQAKSFMGGKVPTLRGGIKDYKITIKNGVTTHDMTMTFGGSDRPLKLSGDVTLADMSMNMNLMLPLELLGATNQQMRAVAPNGIALPVKGTVDAPKFNVAGAVQSTFAIKNPQDLVSKFGGLLGNNKLGADGSAGPNEKPADQAVGAIEGLLNKKDKNKKKPADRDGAATPAAPNDAVAPTPGAPTTNTTATPAPASQPAADDTAKPQTPEDQAVGALEGLLDKKKKPKKPKKPAPAPATAPAE